MSNLKYGLYNKFKEKTTNFFNYFRQLHFIVKNSLRPSEKPFQYPSIARRRASISFVIIYFQVKVSDVLLKEVPAMKKVLK